MPESPQKKQPACDRCRAKKLRCHRTEKLSCSRCIRCNLKCMSSSLRRPGRPLKYNKNDRSGKHPPYGKSGTCNINNSIMKTRTIPDGVNIGDGFIFDTDNVDFDLAQNYWSSMALHDITLEHLVPSTFTSVDSMSFKHPPKAKSEFPDLLSNTSTPFPAAHPPYDFALISHGAETDSNLMDHSGLRIAELDRGLSQQLIASFTPLEELLCLPSDVYVS